MWDPLLHKDAVLHVRPPRMKVALVTRVALRQPPTSPSLPPRPSIRLSLDSEGNDCRRPRPPHPLQLQMASPPQSSRYDPSV